MDFVGLIETHMHTEILDKMNIPGFHGLDTKNKQKMRNLTRPRKG